MVSILTCFLLDLMSFQTRWPSISLFHLNKPPIMYSLQIHLFFHRYPGNSGNIHKSTSKCQINISYTQTVKKCGRNTPNPFEAYLRVGCLDHPTPNQCPPHKNIVVKFLLHHYQFIYIISFPFHNHFHESHIFSIILVLSNSSLQHTTCLSRIVPQYHTALLQIILFHLSLPC